MGDEVFSPCVEELGKLEDEGDEPVKKTDVGGGRIEAAVLRAKGASGACACSVRAKGKAGARIEPYIATNRVGRGNGRGKRPVACHRWPTAITGGGAE
jgi:hypothetical protein